MHDHKPSVQDTGCLRGKQLSPAWILFILTGLNLFNYLDRYVLSAVLVLGCRQTIQAAVFRWNRRYLTTQISSVWR